MKQLTTRRICFAILTALSFSVSLVKAQDDGNTAIRKDLMTDAGLIAVIEMTAAATIQKDERLTATLYRQESKGNTIFAQDMDIKSCSGGSGLPAANAFCVTVPEPGKVQLLYRFNASPAVKDTFLISFATIILTVTGPPEQQVISQRTTGGSVVQVIAESPKGKVALAVVPIDKTFQRRSKPTVNCADNSEYVFTADGAVEMNLKKNVIKIQFELPDDLPARQRRTDALLNWLDAQKANPAGIGEVKIEKRDTTGPGAIYPLSAFTYQVQCKAQLLVDQGLTIFLIGDHDFPASAFDFQVKFNNNPPMEIAKVLKGSSPGLGSVKTPAADTVGTDKTLGLRTFDSNLNWGTAFTSSVSDVKQGNKTVRQRQNAGTVDLRVAPWLNINLSPPRRVQYLITPIFFDAKIASGKITEKTLALNRVLIGSEFDVKYIRSTQSNSSDKHIFRFRFVNASDRDFKRVEEKFNFETDLLFAKLNHPLSEQFKLEDGSINPDAGLKVIPLHWFGYQIQPIVGVDVGKTVRRKRDVFAIENESNFVRRLYFGGDMKFNLTRHFNLTLSDTFYLRGETPKDRARNYFKGLFETPLGSISSNTAQAIFFSFERGDEPPFNSASVNAFKIGYRITTNFGVNGGVR